MSTSDSYDAIPYESTPFAETHPGHVACLARLYGIDAAPPSRSRVLELGCASGGNIIPMAARLPESQFIGIELSAEQALEGEKRVSELGLKNCEIRQGDLLLLQDEGQRFDYIITHGVYSWSPPEVRSRILELSSSLLSENGVAYISYNTYPGWRMRGMLRDMLLHSVKWIASPAERLSAAYDYLNFLEAGLDSLDAVHVDFLKVELERIRSAHPSYLFHEYLEEYNDPILVSDFIASAKEHGLNYICDIELGLQLPAFFGEEFESLLEMIENPVERLQQMDFLLNRNFRQTLLCRDSLKPFDQPDANEIRNLAWLADLHPPGNLDLSINKAETCVDLQGKEFAISHPLSKAAIILLTSHFPSPMAYDDLLAQASKLVKENGGSHFANQEDELLSELFTLFAMNTIQARTMDMLEESFTLPVWQMEKAARLGVLRGDYHLPTRHHASLSLDPFSSRLVHYLNGNNEAEELFRLLFEDFAPDGELHDLIQPGLTDEQLRLQLEQNLEHLLALFRRHGVLG